MATPGPNHAHAMQDKPDATMAHAQGPPWAHGVAVTILGLWRLTSQAALGYDSTALSWSDVISGLVIVALAIVTLAVFVVARMPLQPERCSVTTNCDSVDECPGR